MAGTLRTFEIIRSLTVDLSKSTRNGQACPSLAASQQALSQSGPPLLGLVGQHRVMLGQASSNPLCFMQLVEGNVRAVKDVQVPLRYR